MSSRGGYIDNTPATFARADTDPSIDYAYAGGKVPANSVVINNSPSSPTISIRSPIRACASRPCTGSTRTGAPCWRSPTRVSRRTASSAEMAADSLGKPQPDLTVQLYNPSYDKDRFENTALTIEGRVGALKLVYAGAYLVRNVEQVQDYTSYAHRGST